MTYSINNITNYTLNLNGNYIQIFPYKIEPCMNITIQALSTTVSLTSTTITSTPLSTTIASGSNGYAFSGSFSGLTIHVNNTAGFPSSGTIIIMGDVGNQLIYATYTGITGTSFTGCSGYAFAEIYTSNIVYQSAGDLNTINVVSTANFPSSGSFYIDASGDPTSRFGLNYAEFSYTNITGTSFTGVSIVSSQSPPAFFGSSISPPASNLTTLNVASTIGFPSSGNLRALSFIGSYINIEYTGITGTSFTGCTFPDGIPYSSYPLRNQDILYYNSNIIYILFPNNIPFSATINNAFGSYCNIALASAYGYTASIVDVPTTTVASGSGGASSGEPTLYVIDTTAFPSSGQIKITHGGSDTELAYTGKTMTSFTGCYKIGNSYSTLNTGDTITAYPFGSATGALITGLSNVNTTIEQTHYILIGNSSTNNGLFLISNIIGTTSVSITSPTTIPDPNNGNIYWATLNFNSQAPLIDIVPGTGYIQNYVSDGTYISLSETPPVQQLMWALSTFTPQNNTLVNYTAFEGNLEALVLQSGMVTAPFAIPLAPYPFSITIENQTSYPVTIGYGYPTITSDSVVIPSGQIAFIFGDGVNVYTQKTVGPPVIVNYLNSTYTIISDQSGTTYLVDCFTTSQGPRIINLPSAPANGTQYIFKDSNYSFNDTYYLTINCAGSDFFANGPGINTITLNYNATDLCFTLEYDAINFLWKVINKNKNELTPIFISSLVSSGSVSITDIRQEDCLIYTNPLDSVSIYMYDYFYGQTPYDGQIFSIKDIYPYGSFAESAVYLYTGSQIEFPIGNFSNTVWLNINGLCAKWRYNIGTATWFLIETNQTFQAGPVRPSSPPVGFMFFDTTLTSGTGSGGQPVWWTGTTWVDANGNII